MTLDKDQMQACANALVKATRKHVRFSNNIVNWEIDERYIKLLGENLKYIRGEEEYYTHSVDGIPYDQWIKGAKRSLKMGIGNCWDLAGVCAAIVGLAQIPESDDTYSTKFESPEGTHTILLLHNTNIQESEFANLEEICRKVDQPAALVDPWAYRACLTSELDKLKEQLWLAPYYSHPFFTRETIPMHSSIIDGSLLWKHNFDLKLPKYQETFKCLIDSFFTFYKHYLKRAKSGHLKPYQASSISQVGNKVKKQLPTEQEIIKNEQFLEALRQIKKEKRLQIKHYLAEQRKDKCGLLAIPMEFISQIEEKFPKATKLQEIYDFCNYKFKKFEYVDKEGIIKILKLTLIVLLIPSDRTYRQGISKITNIGELKTSKILSVWNEFCYKYENIDFRSLLPSFQDYSSLLAAVDLKNVEDPYNYKNVNLRFYL